jgi:glycosyltransferase involved in cell wall biosynthesis
LEARLLLAGAPDPENPAAISQAELNAWAAEPGVEWLGHIGDVRQVWAHAHIAVLASRGGEGIPMTLMEAAACARPLVATDVPGCREIVVPEKTGLLAPPNDPAALVDALRRMVEDAELRRRCGAAARERVVSGLDAGTVGRETVAVYRSLLTTKPDNTP